ncbi:MAG: hypothetical protein P8J70_06105 [Glaciecola sp.]|jgi:predicted unusual protein kinase regulating ubiquinone biosynthesis (AarF/ABC1/UbiB family)|nr:hypothetical protein [Glaciecola sp.]MDG1815301.1 hypothetical protein [Glaciecola sp.]MDG2099235.1 hypothetical protein [Glaciecola sp.]
MHNDKFIDPRLQEKEALFQQLHMASFDVIMHINAIQEIVKVTSQDILPTNEHYVDLVRSFKITLAMCTQLEPEINSLAQATQKIMSEDSKVAYASQAQICAAAVNCLNHWRILKQIPEDLLKVDEVTATLKQRFTQHLAMWDGYFASQQSTH